MLSRIGHGGMGVVFAAYDPELDRKVAVKLLHPGGCASGSDGRARLVREAQALARLAHPNVVAVHDVGTRGSDVWLAMELVLGRTLRAWMRERPRPWREVLDALLAAGRGLAAAHSVGLVHRDFKPDNVMIADDGRVRVMDFGLARAVDEHELGRTGALLGTPAYMAPEQLAGCDADALADQFAYCVALWEGLFGARPFAGDTAAELAANVMAGRIRAPTAASVPGWLRRAVERGLAVDPERRWGSLGELLAVLASGQRRARRRTAAAVLAATATTLAAAAGWHALDLRQRAEACDERAGAIAGVWGDESRARVQAALVGSGVAGAETAFARAAPLVDDWTARWSATTRELCIAAEVERELPAHQWERAAQCLDERRDELGALVDVLSRSDSTVVTRAVPAAARLSRLEPCADPATLPSREPPPSEHADDVASLRSRIRDAAALEKAGLYAEGLALAREVDDRAAAIGWAPLHAEARLRLGKLLDRTGDHEASVSSLQEAFFTGGSAGDDEVAVESATQLVFVLGYQLGRHGDALHWARIAEMLLDRTGDAPDSLRRAALAQHRGIVHDLRGEWEPAIADYERSLAIKEATLGPEHADLGAVLDDIAGVHFARGHHERAQPLFERALAVEEQTFGPDHPVVATTLVNLGANAWALGDAEGALRRFERALAIHESTGGRPAEVANVLVNMGIIREGQGDCAEAGRIHRRALAIYERELGADHADVALALTNVGSAAIACSELDEAQQALERAAAIHERSGRLDHPDVASTLVNLAIALRLRGEPDAALPLARRAVDIYARVASDHPGLGVAQREVARARGESSP